MPLGFTPVVIDFESFYSKEFTLKALSATEYIRDPRFKAHGVGLLSPGCKPQWVSGQRVRGVLELNDWSNVAVIAHNCKFDGAIAAWKYGVRPGLWIDTLAMSKAVLGNSVSSHSLDALGKHYELPLEKGIMQTLGIRDLSPEQERELAAYNEIDLLLCWELYQRLAPSFPEDQYRDMDWTIRSFIEPQLELDVPLLEKASAEEAARREAFFQKPGFEKEKFASNVKFPALLQASGYEVPMKNSPAAAKRGEVKMIPALALGDPEFLEMLESEDSKLKELCEARVAAKSVLLETRTGKLAKIGKTGKWPFDVGFSGAQQTHRYSGGNAAGGNPQNFTKGSDLRRGVKAPAGMSLVVGDFASVEPRIVAFLSQDPRLMEGFQKGLDLYCDFASQHYGRQITKADKDERAFGKESILGLGYGMGGEKFAKRVKIKLDKVIDEKEARRVVDLYRSYYGGVQAFWGYLESLLPLMAGGAKGHLFSLPAVKFDGPKFILPSGLMIRYPDLKQDLVKTKTGKERLEWRYTAFKNRRKTPERVSIYGGKMLENLSQALAGEFCKLAIRACRSSLWDAVPCGQVHDEVIAVAPTGEAENYAKWMEDAMSASPEWWPEIKLGAEVGIGPNWLDAKGA